MQDEMIPISITDFISGLAVPVDLFLRLSDDKFVLISKAGARPELGQLKTYQQKEVVYLWVKKSEYSKVSQQTIAIAGVAVKKTDLDFKQKTHVVTAAAKTVFNQLDHIGLNHQTYNEVKLVTETTVQLVESHKHLATLFESLNDCSDSLLRHSMAVSAVSTLLGWEMGWRKAKVTLEKLALGGLLHDIGLKTLPPELLDKPQAQMSYDELQLYETHPYKGMQLATTLGLVPDDIVSIIYEHHENSIGQGYPQRIRDIKIHPLARVVALADEFVHLTIRNTNCPQPKSPREALLYIEQTMGQPFNKECFRALTRMVDKEINLKPTG